MRQDEATLLDIAKAARLIVGHTYPGKQPRLDG
jgi:hypothetical protein